MGLRLLEVREAALVVPARRPSLLPPVVILGVASDVNHGIERAGASPHPATRPVHHTVVDVLLGQRVVIPVISITDYLDIALCSTFNLEKEEGKTTYLSSQRL